MSKELSKTAEEVLKEAIPKDCQWDEGWGLDWKLVNTPSKYVRAAMHTYASMKLDEMHNMLINAADFCEDRNCMIGFVDSALEQTKKEMQ